MLQIKEVNIFNLAVKTTDMHKCLGLGNQRLWSTHIFITFPIEGCPPAWYLEAD